MTILQAIAFACGGLALVLAIISMMFARRAVRLAKEAEALVGRAEQLNWRKREAMR